MLAYQTYQVYAQTEKSHYDNKPYVEGEMLVQIDEKVSLKGLLLNLPNEYETSIIEEVSNPMRIWLISSTTKQFHMRISKSCYINRLEFQ
jgi:hypothetical protein